MRVLVTGARAPVALDMARALGRAGHWVAVADTMRVTLAGASRYVARRIVLPPPRYQPLKFARALADAVERHGIDLVIPTCEEVFYVSWAREALALHASVLCEPLCALRELHSKAAFGQRAAEKGIATPRTIVVESDAALRAALSTFTRYVLKPAFSRFATRVITNNGAAFTTEAQSHREQRPFVSSVSQRLCSWLPRGTRFGIGDCHPTPAQPWLVQEYVEGEAVCSYTVLHGGRATAHCAYTTPHTAGGGAGTAFVSIDGGPTLEIARALAGRFTGQLSLDFIRDAAGRLVVLECNPRATSGLHLLAPARLAGALLDPRQPTWVEPPGKRRQIALAALPTALLPTRARTAGTTETQRHRERFRFRFSVPLLGGELAPDVIFAPDDPLPALAQLAPLLHFTRVSLKKRIGLIEATTDDIEWNGEELPIADSR